MARLPRVEVLAIKFSEVNLGINWGYSLFLFFSKAFFTAIKQVVQFSGGLLVNTSESMSINVPCGRYI